jgi:hypothetical protein
MQEEDLLNVSHFAIDKDYLHIFVDEDLLRAEINDLVWIAEGLLYLVWAHAEFHGLALDCGRDCGNSHILTPQSPHDKNYLSFLFNTLGCQLLRVSR